ncbi:MAG: PAS domain-containing protein [Pseudomonadota bacterium]
MTTATTIDHEQSEWLIDDEHPEVADVANAATDGSVAVEPWNVLIVDDDVDVHVVTKFALRDVRYKGRPLNFLHAYSAKEGFSLLRDTPDVALVLLDVIMETDHAGLVLARQIRGELNNHQIRIVLRTGQSGQTLEQSVIVDYDINDYRTKSDLTTQKLFTTVISSLRAYDSLMIANHSLETLKIAQKKVKELRAALDHHTAVSITDLVGKITYANALFCRWSQYSQEELLGKEHHMLASGAHPKAFMQEVWQAITQGQTWHGAFKNRAKDGSPYCLDTTIIPILNVHGMPAYYLAIHTKTDTT